MTKGYLEITPSVTVKDLLDTYPGLEDELISIAPPFKKLRNPLLRRSVAKVATIRHIASVAGIPLDELISKIRTAVGQAESGASYEDAVYFTAQPDWFSPDKIVLSIDEDKVEDKDTMTLVVILKQAQDVKKGEIIELVTTFLPAPGIDRMRSKGYLVWACQVQDNLIKTYFIKNTD